MARIKGSKMTEEAKAAMRAKRKANKEGKEVAFVVVTDNLKYLSYEELQSTISLAESQMAEKKNVEVKRLTDRKKEIEEQLSKLNKSAN